MAWNRFGRFNMFSDKFESDGRLVSGARAFLPALALGALLFATAGLPLLHPLFHHHHYHHHGPAASALCRPDLGRVSASAVHDFRAAPVFPRPGVPGSPAAVSCRVPDGAKDFSGRSRDVPCFGALADETCAAVIRSSSGLCFICFFLQQFNLFQALPLTSPTCRAGRPENCLLVFVGRPRSSCFFPRPARAPPFSV